LLLLKLGDKRSPAALNQQDVDVGGFFSIRANCLHISLLKKNTFNFLFEKKKTNIFLVFFLNGRFSTYILYHDESDQKGRFEIDRSGIFDRVINESLSNHII